LTPGEEEKKREEELHQRPYGTRKKKAPEKEKTTPCSTEALRNR